MLTIQAIAWGLAVIDQTIFVSITENCNFIQKRISLLRWGLRVFPGCQDSYDLSECHRPCGFGRHKEPPLMVQMGLRRLVMSSQAIQTMPFTQIIAFKGYIDNLGKPLNSTLTHLIPGYNLIDFMLYSTHTESSPRVHSPNNVSPSFAKYL